MYSGVNPEAIGLFGLIMTVWVFGLEQLGFGMKGADHGKVAKTLALVAFWFGGVTQVFTAVVLYLTNVPNNPGLSIYLATIFADYGLFWIVVAYFFENGGDKKVMAHFFIVQGIISVVFTYIAVSLGLIWPLGVVLALIVGLFAILPFVYYGMAPGLVKVAGALNIAIGCCALPLLLKQLFTVLK
jgi:uncharacterized protein